MAENNITIEIVLAMHEKQYLRTFRLPEKTTVEQAILQSGFIEQYPDIIEKKLFAINARQVTPDTILHNNDRIDICRPLIIDPKTARRQRAEQQKNTL